ncbi:NAD-dependent epimerase/dehydratase family protein [Candidatus Nitrospira bockiana]
MKEQMILVTGAAGYIGCVLVNKLIDRGYRVRAYDKLYYGDEGLQSARGKIEIVQGDLRWFDAKVLECVTGVVHLAGLSNDPTAHYNPIANYKINTVMTEVLAKSCKERKIKRFTFASTCSIYDLGLEAEDVLKDEDSDVNPRAPYATSNYEAERILSHLMDDDFCPVSLRQGTVYGYSPRMRFDLVVNTFVKDALTRGSINVDCGGEMWRPLVDVGDVAEAHIACLEAPIEKVRGQVFNIVYQNYRILELAHYVVDSLKNDVPVKINVDYSHRRSRSYRVSGHKIKTYIGFQPKIGVKESLADMVMKLRGRNYSEFLHPKYYNIQWMTILDYAEKLIRQAGPIF